MWLNVVDGVRFIVQQLVNTFNFLDFEIFRYTNVSGSYVYVSFLDLLFFTFVFYLTMKFFIFRH